MIRDKWRLFWMFAVGTGANHFVFFLAFQNRTFDWYPYTMGWIQSMLITALIWEGALRFDRYVDVHITWDAHPLKRLLV